jgi:tRNA 2-selenouridine synthase
VEAESRKIGSVALPPALLQAMHRGACIEVISSREDRAAFLQQDYAQLFENPDWLKTQLQRLLGLHSRDVINGWLKMVDEGRRIDLARELIDRHYDPAYARSSHTHFTQLPQATRMAFRPNDADGVEQARALLKALA